MDSFALQMPTYLIATWSAVDEIIFFLSLKSYCLTACQCMLGNQVFSTKPLDIEFVLSRMSKNVNAQGI